MTTSWALLASTASTDFQSGFPPSPPVHPQRFNEATTSAVIFLPLWNRTPLRKVIVYRRPPPVTMWAAARWGIGFQSLSKT